MRTGLIVIGVGTVLLFVLTLNLLANEANQELTPAQKEYFMKDEYGVIYWESKGDWTYNWKFKTKMNFKKR